LYMGSLFLHHLVPEESPMMSRVCIFSQVQPFPASPMSSSPVFAYELQNSNLCAHHQTPWHRGIPSLDCLKAFVWTQTNVNQSPASKNCVFYNFFHAQKILLKFTECWRKTPLEIVAAAVSGGLSQRFPNFLWKIAVCVTKFSQVDFQRNSASSKVFTSVCAFRGAIGEEAHRSIWFGHQISHSILLR